MHQGLARGGAGAKAIPTALAGLAALAALAALGAAPAAADSAPAAAPATADSTPAAAPAAAPPAGRRPRKVITEPPPPEPDPAAVEQAAESNLIPEGPRSGMAFGAFFMGWQQFGTVDDAGRGAGLGLRLGHTASPSTVVWIELVAGAFPDDNSSNSDCQKTDPEDYCLSRIESNAALVATAQHYVSPNTWLRGGAGLATYTRVLKKLLDEDPDYEEVRQARAGVTVLAGAGVDLVRRHRTRLALESILTAQRFSAGWVFDIGVGIGLAFY